MVNDMDFVSDLYRCKYYGKDIIILAFYVIE